jgi:ubiquinone biosynthesis protein UbiJ
MANPFTDFVLPAATARFVLMANHVLASAPVAPEKLRAHQGRVLKVDVDGWRGPFPQPPALVLRVTPAGLFEAVDAMPEGAEIAADLTLRVDVSQPFDAARRVISGDMPPVQIDGDAAFAADVSWIIANVRWDIAADLERVFGATLADTVARAGERAMATAKSLAQGAASVMRKS